MNEALVSLVAASGILITWLVLASCLAGIGFLILRPFKPSRGDAPWFTAFWLGFVGLLAFLQLWHFFAPVTWVPALMVVTAGAGGLFLQGAELTAAVRAVRARERAVGLMLLGAVGLWAANQTTGAPLQFDTGMYHLPAVKWFETYPIVPGLGNLHGRLAFNNSSLLYAALLDWGPWSGRVTHVANGLLVFVLLLQIGWSAAQLRRAPAGEPMARHAFDLVLLAPTLATLRHFDTRSLGPDVAVTVLLLVAASRTYTFLIGRRTPPERLALDVVVIAALLSAAVTVKLSAAAFAAGTWAVVIAVGLARSARGASASSAPAASVSSAPATSASSSTSGSVRSASAASTPASGLGRRTLVWAVAATLVIGGPWLVRGAVLSGYPLYPSGALAVDVDWRVPAEQVAAERAWTREHGQWPRPGPGLSWVGPWLKSMGRPYRRQRVLLPVAVAAAAAVGLLALRRRGRHLPDFARPGWLLLVPIALGTLFWLATSPHPRFGFFLFWALASLTVAQLVLLPQTPTLPVRRAILAGGLVLGALPLLDVPLRQLARGSDLSAVARRALLEWPPGPDWGLHGTPSASLATYTTDSGLVLHVPTDDNRCWEAPLPCTPHPAPNLQLRDPDDPARGFRVDDVWRPVNWPNPASDFLDEFRRRRSATATEP